MISLSSLMSGFSLTDLDTSFATMTAFTLVAAAGGALALTLWRSGLHKALLSRLAVKEELLGPYMVLYKNVTGPSKAVPQAHKDLSKLLVDIGLVHHSRFYRHPSLTVLHETHMPRQADSCRASVGYIFKSGVEVSNPQDAQRHERLLQCFSAVKNGELLIAQLPRSRSLVVNAPLLGSLSLLVATLRSYPLLKAALQEQPREVQQQIQGSLEIYLPEEDRTIVAFPLEPQKQLTATE